MDQSTLDKFFRQLTKSEINGILFVDSDRLDNSIVFTINYLVLIMYNILYHDAILNRAYIYVHDKIQKIFSPFNLSIKNKKDIIRNARNRKLEKYDFVLNYIKHDRKKIMRTHFLEYFRSMYNDLANIQHSDTTYTQSQFDNYKKKVEERSKDLDIEKEVDHVIEKFYVPSIIKFSSKRYMKKIKKLCDFFQKGYTDEFIRLAFNDDTFKKGYDFEKHISDILIKEADNIFLNCVSVRPQESIKAEFDVVVGEIHQETIKIQEIYEIKSNTHNIGDDLEKLIKGVNHFSHLKINDKTYNAEKQSINPKYIVAKKDSIILSKSENEIFKIVLDCCRKKVKGFSKNILNCIQIVHDKNHCDLDLSKIHITMKTHILTIIDKHNNKMKELREQNEIYVYEYIYKMN